MKQVNLLYITRKYPPMVGGMENMSAALAKEFTRLVPTTLIAWGKSQKYLPYFIPLAFMKACFFIPTKKITHLHIGDAFLAPVGLVLKVLFGVKASINIAGLDIIFTFPGYQWLIPKCVAQFDLIICISNATRVECIKRGIPANKCIVIPCGVYPEAWNTTVTRDALTQIIQENAVNKKVFLTVGRLVKRKGVAWFIQNVLPHLHKDTMYLVIGDGPESVTIQKLIKNLKLEKRVLLLGKIPDETLKIIYNTADAFVMPNILVPGTMEGFGIVAVEASSTGLPVIASDCEGIRDAVVPGKTGTLVIPGDTNTFIRVLNDLRFVNKKSIRTTTKQQYSWPIIGSQYINSFQKL